jgi:hypothetical protein
LAKFGKPHTSSQNEGIHAHPKQLPALLGPDCLRYWDLADHIRINDAIALWCGAYSTRNWTTIPRGSGQ